MTYGSLVYKTNECNHYIYDNKLKDLFFVCVIVGKKGPRNVRNVKTLLRDREGKGKNKKKLFFFF